MAEITSGGLFAARSSRPRASYRAVLVEEALMIADGVP
jgi:hypothetical protein